ncbi:MAG: hypothetical protein K2G31_04290, partial [Clostridia bacterium]|nr:hypothetical protein [Clostridia bacterium]
WKRVSDISDRIDELQQIQTRAPQLETRIAELEAKGTLTADEEVELADIKKELADITKSLADDNLTFDDIDSEIEKQQAELKKWNSDEYKAERYHYSEQPKEFTVKLDDYYVVNVNGAKTYYLASATDVYTKDGDNHTKEEKYDATDGKDYYVLEGLMYLPIERVVKAQKAERSYSVVIEGSGATVALQSYPLFENVGTNGNDSFVSSDLFVYDVDNNDVRYVNYNGVYRRVSGLKVFKSGYFKSQDERIVYEDGEDEVGDFYRTVKQYGEINEFMLGLKLSVGVLNMGLSLGQLDIDLGGGINLLPDYIRDGVGHKMLVEDGEYDRYSRDLLNSMSAADRKRAEDSVTQV